MIYWIRAGALAAVKVGRTTNLTKRIALLQTGCPFPLILLRREQGGEATETALHQHYAAKKLHGEWFALSDADVGVDLAAIEPARPRPLHKSVQPRSFVTRPLSDKDMAVEMPVPFGWKAEGWAPTHPALPWARALHGWMVQCDRSPQELAPKVGVIPHTVAGWIGYGTKPQRVPAMRLVEESGGALAEHLIGTPNWNSWKANRVSMRETTDTAAP